MDEFAGDACKTVAAQICEAVGFEAVTASSLDTLSEVLAAPIDGASPQPPLIQTTLHPQL